MAEARELGSSSSSQGRPVLPCVCRARVHAKALVTGEALLAWLAGLAGRVVLCAMSILGRVPAAAPATSRVRPRSRRRVCRLHRTQQTRLLVVLGCRQDRRWST